MLKNILKLDGAQQLSKNEQKSISGGIGGGKCVNSNINCWGLGNAGCPTRQGCFLDEDINGNLSASCRCL